MIGCGWIDPQHRGATPFVFVGVGLHANQILVAALTVGQQRAEIALRAAGQEQRCGEAQVVGQPLLQGIDRWVFPVDIVTNRRRQHGLAHGLGRPGHGIAAQIDRHPESPGLRLGRRACHGAGC